MWGIVGQALGICGSGATVLSYQTKKPKLYCLFQALSGTFFTISFLLLGSPTSAILNALNVIRGLLLAGGERFRKTWVLIAILAANVICSAGTVLWQYYYPIAGWEDRFVTVAVLAGLVLVAQITSTFAMWSDDGRILRALQFCVVSPCWMVNNVFVLSIGGMICESFTIVSILVSLLRFGWKGLAKGAAGTGTEK